MLLNLASRLSCRFTKPFSIAREISFPCERNTSRFSSTESSSVCKIRCCISGDWGIIPNCSCVRMIASQLLFFISLKIFARLAGVKSSLPGYNTLAFGYAVQNVWAISCTLALRAIMRGLLANPKRFFS